MDFLLWLDQLQDLHAHQVGSQLIYLSQILGAGYPVKSGFVIPDGVMRTVWAQISGSDEVLQDFPYLRLNFSLDQATQVRLIAQTLQQKILSTTLDSQWDAVWGQGIKQLTGQQLKLTPYLWTPQNLQGLKGSLSTRLLLSPLISATQTDAFWQTLKTIWAQLWQAQHLYVLQHLGLYPEQVYLSVLVQALPLQRRSGVLKVTSTHILIQADDELEQEWTGLGSYVYDRSAQTLIKTHSSTKQPSLSDDTLHSILNLGKTLDLEPLPLTFSWLTAADPLDPSAQILGITNDLPIPTDLPMSATLAPLQQERSPAPNAFTETSVQTALNARQPLAKGTSAAAGSIAAAVLVVNDFQTISPVQLQDKILVTHQLEPIHLPWLNAAAGLICETGSITSHGAILARELGRPAIVGASGILKILQSGQWVFLDGGQGEVYAYEAKESFGEPSFHSIDAAFTSQTQEIPLTKTQIFVNLSQPNLLDQAKAARPDGLGLIRGEWLLLDRLSTCHKSLSHVPAESPLFKAAVQDALYNLVHAFAPQPVYYRFTDLSPSERPLFVGDLKEDNLGCHPALGLRGTLWHCQDNRLFEMELSVVRGLLSMGVNNLRLILPFVRSPQEVQDCIDKMQRAGIDPQRDVFLWIMVEVPSVLFTLERYASKGIQGIAIGMNDLTQLLLGIDRNHSHLATVTAQNQPAILSAIGQLVQRATALNLSSVFYGSITQYPTEWLAQLVNDGIMGISVEIANIERTRLAIAQAEQKCSRQIPTTTSLKLRSPQERGGWAKF